MENKTKEINKELQELYSSKWEGLRKAILDYQAKPEVIDVSKPWIL
jgi:hypothetical protein